jgi:Sulfotransferase family
MKSDDETVIFLHIPKTGGTTLQHILEQCYPGDQICTFKDPNRDAQIENFKRSAAGRREPYRLIQGHLSFGFHRYVPGRSTYITFLREPVARTLSFYYHARTRPDHYLHPLLKDDRANLKMLLRQQTATSHEFFNLQTAMIAGEEWGNPQRPVDRVALEQAKQNLRTHFQVVGLTEQFDASLRLMSRHFGWKVGAYKKKNVTSRKPPAETVDTETKQLLREANALDIELYQFAQELFAAQRGVGNNHRSALRPI